jgi:inorganic pyrophosphatase
MEDEGGIDEKVFVVPSNELEEFLSMRDEKKNEIYEDIAWFFSNYKNKELVKWSKVHNTMNREEAIEVYKKYITIN